MKSRRRFVLVLLVVAVILSASIFVAFQHYKSTVSTHQAEDVGTAAGQVSAELGARLDGHRQTVDLWGANPSLRAHGTADQQAALEAFVNRTAFAGGSVIAANGTMTGIAAGLPEQRRQELTGSDFSERTYHKRAMDGRTYVSDPIQADSGNYIITISTPIREDGAIVGTFNGAFHLSDPGFFEPVLASLPDHAGITIAAESGDSMYSRPASPNGDVVVRNRTVNETGWTVSVRESRSVIQPQLRMSTYLQFGGLVSVLVAIVGLGWWNDRRNLKQVERLLDGFDALQAREYGTRIDVGGAEEWDRIGDGFNRMSRTIDQYFTEREQRDQQLEILDRMLRHNLRNDMNVIVGRAESMAATGGDAVADEAADIIATAGQLLAKVRKERTIYELLQENPSPTPLSVCEVVRAATEQVRDDYPDAEVSLECVETATGLGVPHLETAVTELVTNGIEHTDDGPPEVTVSVRTEPSTVVIEIADTGPGIPEMEQQLLTGARDIDPLNHSQGLGLWLVYWIVDLSEGQLRFENNEAGGSVVIVELTRVEQPA